jgi:hypothetical protein
MLDNNFTLERYGLYVRLVNEDDAEFIVQLRTDSKLNRYINTTENDVKKQKEWIRAYKDREKEGTEYYFIFHYNLQPVGLDRIYNVQDSCFTTGSWIFKRGTDYQCSILGNIITRELAYDLFPNKELLFDVRKNNKNVLVYHKKYNPILIDEDELNYYYKLPRENFINTRDKILKLLKQI